MFLKRLELAGFKSFADKTELEFSRGIAAVVGPNGSGKSNISDAIRWVLGEQSARSLRGGKMEDVIFAGSDGRKAVNYADVSITFDNGDQALPLDFHEVTVTRRLHRSGDSEYFINRQSCRLKDITELFMDTGIGKEAYSIIGQGKIEEILSTKSEERRSIFEEASGIVKYKTRKKEAEKKLDETEQNLLRIHDLVSELQDQIEPLREQSEKAQAFRQLKEQLKSSEIALYVHQIDQLHRSWLEEGDKLQSLQTEQAELSAVVGLYDAELEKRRLEARRSEEDLEERNRELLTLSEEAEKCEGYGEVLKERAKNLAANRAQLAQTVEIAEKKIADKDSEISAYREKVNAIDLQLAELKNRLVEEEDKLTQLTGGANSGTEEELKADLFELLNKTAQARNEIKYAEQNIDSLKRRSERMDEEQKKWSDLQAKHSENRIVLQRQTEAAASEIERIRGQYITTGEQLKAKQDLLAEVEQTVRKWEQQRGALTSRRDTMQEMHNDYDGFAQGVREVLKAKKANGGLAGIHGAVAELMKVPAHLETAMETALGGALQHIVVENEKAGREAIDYLKKRQFGRATFLPLDIIRGRSVAASDLQAMQSQSGFVGIALALILFEQKYEAIFSSLLGNVIVAQSLEQANRIAAKSQYRYRVVTLDGDVVNPGGSMTGGSAVKKGANLLGRKRLMLELEQQIAACDEQLRQLREKAEQAQAEIDRLTLEIEQLRRAGEQKRSEEQQLRADMQLLEGESRNVEEQIALIDIERQSLADEMKQFMGNQETAAEQLRLLEEEENRLQQEIRAAEEQRKTSESEKEERQAELTALKVKTAAVMQEKQSLQEQLNRFFAERGELLRQLENDRAALRQLEEESAATQQEMTDQIERFNELSLKKRQCAEQIELKRAERADWLKKIEAEENASKEQRRELREIEERLRQTEVRVNRLDVELDNLLKQLGEEYELSYEWAKAKYPPPEDIIGTQNRVRDLKREISLLGEVNLGAVEEYQRVNDRYQFLNAQKNDLIAAKTALYQVIREMDEEMSRRFCSTFESIRAQFSNVFSKLFGGGRADLILSEPDRPLDTGIDIVAQPPGKKLQNLQLLSGGERALTAIALLFAILRIKPVPFCVMDEVEAALDESNVTRFSGYLREFSAHTQFIVVTHRKGTMEEADVLYGVTMEEGGVSKMVSVRLDDNDMLSA